MRATVAALFLAALLSPASVAEQATRAGEEETGWPLRGEPFDNEGSELISEFKHALGVRKSETREDDAAMSLQVIPAHQQRQLRRGRRHQPFRKQRARGRVLATKALSAQDEHHEFDGVRNLVARVDEDVASIRQCQEQRVQADEAAAFAREAEAAAKQALGRERQRLRAAASADRRRERQMKRMATVMKAFKSKLQAREQPSESSGREDVGQERCQANLQVARSDLEARVVEVRAAAQEISWLKTRLGAAERHIHTFALEREHWAQKQAQGADHKVDDAKLELASVKAKATASNEVDESQVDSDSFEVEAFRALNQTQKELKVANAKAAALEEAEKQALKALGLQKNFDALQLEAAHKTLNDTRVELEKVKSREAALEEADKQARRMFGLEEKAEATQMQAALHALNASKAELAGMKESMAELKARDARERAHVLLRADFDAMEVHATESVLNSTRAELLATKASAMSQKKAFEHTMNQTFEDLAFAKGSAEAFKEAEGRAMKIFGLEADFDHLEVHAEDALLNHTRAELAEARSNTSEVSKKDAMALEHMHEDLTALEKADHWARKQLGLHANLTALALHADTTILKRTQAELSEVRSRATAVVQVLNTTQEQLDVERAHREALQEADALAHKILGLHSDLAALELRSDGILLKRTQAELATAKAQVDDNAKALNATREQLAAEKAHEDALKAADAWAWKQFGLRSNLTALELLAYRRILNKTRADLAFANGNANSLKEARDWLNTQLEASKGRLANEALGASSLRAELAETRRELNTSQEILAATRTSLTAVEASAKAKAAENENRLAASLAEEKIVNADFNKRLAASEKMVSATRADREAEAEMYQAEADTQRLQLQLADKKVSKNERSNLVQELKATTAKISKLNVTHAVLASEWGATLREFQATTDREISDVVQLHSQIGEEDDELAADHSQFLAKARELRQALVRMNSAAHNASLAKDLGDQLRHANATLLDLHAKLAARDSKLSEANAALLSAAAQAVELQQLREKVNKTGVQFNALRLSLASRAQEVHATRAKLSEAEGTLSVTRNALAKAVGAEKDLHDMGTKLGAAKIELNTFRIALRKRSEELSLSHSRIEAAQRLQRAGAVAAGVEGKRLAALEASLGKKSSELQRAERQVGVEGEHVAALEAVLGKKNAQLQTAQKQLASEARELLASQTQLNSTELQVRALNSTHRKLALMKVAEGAQVSKLRSQLQALNAAHSQALADAKAQAEVVVDLQGRLRKVAQMTADDLAARDHDDSLLGDKIRSDEKELNAQNATLMATRASLQEAQSELASQKLDLARARASDASAERRARLEHDEAAAANATLRELRSQLAAKDAVSKAKQAALAAAVEAEKKQVAAGRAELASLRAKQNATEGTVHELEGEVAQAKLQVAKDAEVLRLAQAKQAHLKKKIGAKYGKVVRELAEAQHAEGELQARNKALEAEVGGNHGLFRHRRGFRVQRSD